jgi:hypothetical protein
MVLCYSRMIYLEFTLSEGMEQFLSCHRHAREFFGGSPAKVMLDNLKTGVREHPPGMEARFNPRYLDFAAHYGFTPVACQVRKANEKGRVENGVGYVKKNFLNGLEVPPFSALNPAARQWMDTVANVRLHGETHCKPLERFAQEKPLLRALPALAYDYPRTVPVGLAQKNQSPPGSKPLPPGLPPPESQRHLPGHRRPGKDSPGDRLGLRRLPGRALGPLCQRHQRHQPPQRRSEKEHPQNRARKIPPARDLGSR